MNYLYTVNDYTKLGRRRQAKELNGEKKIKPTQPMQPAATHNMTQPRRQSENNCSQAKKYSAAEDKLSGNQSGGRRAAKLWKKGRRRKMA